MPGVKGKKRIGEDLHLPVDAVSGIEVYTPGYGFDDGE